MQSEKLTYFRIVFDYITARFPYMQFYDASPIHIWYEQGYHFESCVQPAVDYVERKKILPQSFSYFTTVIRNRLKTVAAVTVHSKGSKPYRKEKFVPRERVERSPQEQEALARWKQERGLAETPERVISAEERARTLEYLDSLRRPVPKATPAAAAPAEG